MNDELQKQLAAMLANLATVAQQGAAFAADQIPPLVQEKIALGRTEATFWFAAAAILSVASVYWMARLRRWAEPHKAECDEKAKTGHYHVDRDGYQMPLFFGHVVGILLAVLPLIATVHDLLLVWFAPRLYIVEWLRSMVGK